MKLSKHFTLAELTATSVREFPNTPTLEEADNLAYLAQNVLEPTREVFGPMYTTSAYRSRDVNRVIGGSKNSAHIYGLAWDGVPLRARVRWSDVITFLIQNEKLPVDQVIYEYGRWLHIGTRPPGQRVRREALMIFKPGEYEVWNPKDPRITR